MHLPIHGETSALQRNAKMGLVITSIYQIRLKKEAEIAVHFVQDKLLLLGYHRTVEGSQSSQEKEYTMRKVISFMHVSLDGFTTGPNGELEWAIVDEELNPYVDALFRNVDTALYGRVTYLGMQSYWPTVLTDPEASPRDLAHAHWVENVSKIVFSTTLSHAEWRNSRLVKDRSEEHTSEIQSQSNLVC